MQNILLKLEQLFILILDNTSSFDKQVILLKKKNDIVHELDKIYNMYEDEIKELEANEK